MASLMENLISVLEQQYSEYETLLKLSMDKTPVIIKGDLELLQRITDDEQTTVSNVNHYEHDRMEVMKDIANVINKDVETLKLNDLILMLADRPQEQKKLIDIQEKLRTIAKSMQRVNEQNRDLLKSSLEMVEFDLNLIQSMKQAPETANYNRGAYNTGSIMGMPAGNFDAKQ